MKLIFVYNAKSGIASTIKDIGHKLLSPQTYDCFLCRLTHGTFREEPSWKSFRQNSGIEMEFLHSNEFEQLYDRKEAYPAVLKNSGFMEVVISRDQLAHLTSVGDLIVAVKSLKLEPD